MTPVKTVTLSEATEIVRKHFECICNSLLTFSVLSSIDDARLPYIAIRCRERCWLEQELRVHDVTINRDGQIRSTQQIGIDGKGPLPGFTAQ